LLYEAKRKVFWTRVRLPPGPPKGDCMDSEYLYQLVCGVLSIVLIVVFFIVFFWWASHGFDRATSKQVDSTSATM